MILLPAKVAKAAPITKLGIVIGIGYLFNAA
jgi:hypothetical protein